MSGGIVFENGKYWGKAGWVYRPALDGICEALRQIPEGADLLREMEDECGTARTIEFIDLKDWPPTKRDQFHRAIDAAVRRFRERGPVDWQDPSFFPSFLRAATELHEMAVAARGAPPV